MEIDLFKIYELNEIGRKAMNADKIFILQKESATGYYLYFSNQLDSSTPSSGLLNGEMFKQIVK